MTDNIESGIELGKTPETELPPMENELRRKVIKALTALNDEQEQQLMAFVGEYLNGKNVNDVSKFLTEGISRAKKANDWNAGSSIPPIEIGYYRNEGQYNADLFHECGHYVLRKLGIDRNSYQQNSFQEEDFCWKFSRKICKVAGLSYAPESESFAKRYQELNLKYPAEQKNTPEFRIAFETLIDQENEVQGYSAFDGTKVVSWTEEGRPFIVDDK
jgi:hypothetical protein